MQVGGLRRVRVSPHLAYGAAGVPGLIPANAVLTFEVELLEVLDYRPQWHKVTEMEQKHAEVMLEIVEPESLILRKPNGVRNNMGLKIERLPAPVWVRPLIPVAAIIITFLLTATLIVLVKANPLEAYYYFLVDPLSSRVSAIEVLVKATPLLLTGAAVTFAFAGGYWNIGAEGQLYAGAVAATAIGLQMDDKSPWLALPLMIVGGFLAGHAVGADSRFDEGKAGY